MLVGQSPKPVSSGLHLVTFLIRLLLLKKIAGFIRELDSGSAPELGRCFGTLEVVEDDVGLLRRSSHQVPNPRGVFEEDGVSKPVFSFLDLLVHEALELRLEVLSDLVLMGPFALVAGRITASGTLLATYDM